MKKYLIIAGCAIVVIVCVAGISFRKIYRQFMVIETVHYDPQLSIYLGGGGNSIVLTSEDGSKALVVDTKMGKTAKKLRDEVKAKDITVVNTHLHRDHIGGNALYPDAKIISGAYMPEEWKVNANNNRYPDETVKPGEEIVQQIGSETVHIRNMGQAHTWNDVVVYCENRKLLVTGDIVFLATHPVLFTKTGANVASWINVLDSLNNRYQVKTLVPGHGRISDQIALLTMKDYFVSIGEAIGNPEKQAVLEQKYRGYFKVPGMSGLEKTLAFIENERKNR
jgi:glyoxylase-like metal-dependent hydrolase (beta-lactamase superfamily II)